jgi:hypothetical protein
MTIRNKAVGLLLVAAVPAFAQERAMVPVTIDGEAVRLATITHKPVGPGPGAAFGQRTIWLYGDHDPYYPLSHSRANFAAFQAAGGKGAFHDFTPAAGASGHAISSQPALWSATLEAYLAQRGLLPAKSR